VLWTRRDGGLYQNTVTGVRAHSVRMGLDCGHVTRWAPLGDNFTAPVRGDREMCAVCIQAALDALNAGS